MAATTEVGKPGTNWKQVSPANRKRIDAIVRHYAKDPHPFTACVRDNTKRFGEDRAKRICAVVKDMGERSTKWRKGPGKKVVESASLPVLETYLFETVMAPTLDAAGVTLDELAGWVEDAQAAGLLVEAGCDELTAEQLAAAAPAAADRLALLERAGLPATGPGARLDRRIVEAGTTKLNAARKAMADRAAGKTGPGATNGQFEQLHPRGHGGSFVRKGGSGREVRAVQRRVGARVDGDFGDKTKAAVVRFQKAHGLVADGIVGRQTVAAMRGRKDAKRVKVGSLTDGDRTFLAGHVRGKGGKRRVVEAAAPPLSRVVEAVAIGSLLERVRQLEPGEHAMLPDGGAVQHRYTADGREVWVAGRPVSYNEDRVSWSGGDSLRRTPEEAVADAFTQSAGRTDPESIGGTTPWYTWSSVAVNGADGMLRRVNEYGQPVVRLKGEDTERATTWESLSRTPAGEASLVEAAVGTFTEDKHPRDPVGKFRKKFGRALDDETLDHTSGKGLDKLEQRVTALHKDAKGSDKSDLKSDLARVKSEKARRGGVDEDKPDDSMPAWQKRYLDERNAARKDKTKGYDKHLADDEDAPKAKAAPKAKPSAGSDDSLAALTHKLSEQLRDPGAKGFKTGSRAADVRKVAHDLEAADRRDDDKLRQKAIKELGAMRVALERQKRTDAVKALDAIVAKAGHSAK